VIGPKRDRNGAALSSLIVISGTDSEAANDVWAAFGACAECKPLGERLAHFKDFALLAGRNTINVLAGMGNPVPHQTRIPSGFEPRRSEADVCRARYGRT
jgi:hypothetical protein